jgi:hypothetical protein
MVNRDVPLVLMQEQVFGVEAGRFDIIHSHLDFLGFPLSRRCATRYSRLYTDDWTSPN